jgi:hypothetical protein
MVYMVHVKSYNFCSLQLSCFEAKSPNIQYEFYHVPLKSYAGVEKLLPDVCIAISGYAAYEKKYIEGVATAMGARFVRVSNYG